MGACIISGTDAFVSVHCVYREWEYNIKVRKLPVTKLTHFILYSRASSGFTDKNDIPILEDLIDRYILKISDAKSIDEELPFDWITVRKNGGRFIGHHKKSKNLHTLFDNLKIYAIR